MAAQVESRGIWLSTGGLAAAELAAAAGFDWALLDLEHGLGGMDDALRQIEALSATPCAPLVRVPAADSHYVPRLLDHGAAGLMAPMIQSSAQASAWARALRYPPRGTRGMTRSSRASRYGHAFKEYFQRANDSVVTLVQIETAQAVEQVDAIAATTGVDVVFIGHSDLSLNLGCFEQMEAPALQEAEAAVLAACVRHNKRAGLLLREGMSVAKSREKGFSFMALGSDLGCLKQGFRRLLDAG